MYCQNCGNLIQENQIAFCPNCGAKLPTSDIQVTQPRTMTTYCRNCGKELIGKPDLCMNCGARPMAGNSFCMACGNSTNPLSEICIRCGVRLVRTSMPIEAKRPRPIKLTIAGIVNIVGGGLSLFGAILWSIIAAVSGFLSSFTFGIVDFNILGLPPGAIAFMSLIAGIMGIISGSYALKVKSWGFVLTGSIALTLLVFPMYWISIMGIASIILIVLSKKSFI